MFDKLFGRRRKMNAGRSGSAAQVTAGPATELLMQVARLHASVN